MRLFAIGDIHGCINPFNDLLEKISLTKEDKLILLGDYIDRGPNSKAVLDKIIELKQLGFNITPLLGNHEIMLLRAIESTKYFDMWMLNGGWTTLENFKCTNPNEIPEKYKSLISDMPYFLKFNNYLFVHAGFNDSIDDPFTDLESMLWIRKTEYTPQFIQENTIVHGHTPIPLSQLKDSLNTKPKVINLDSGCVYNKRSEMGFLSAYCFSTEQFFTSQNK